MKKKILFTILLTGLLSACVPTQSGASLAVENYLQALADKDEESLLARVCPEYEFDALIEFDALAQVQTELKDVSCHQIGDEEGYAYVACSGSIVSNYGSELFKYDLSGRTYEVTSIDGENWLVCGYTE